MKFQLCKLKRQRYGSRAWHKVKCKQGETNGNKAKKIAPKLFLSHRITWCAKKILLKCVFLKKHANKANLYGE